MRIHCITIIQVISVDGEETYTHYFKSKCHPTCPDIIVEEIEQKRKMYCAQIAGSLQLDFGDAKSQTVKEVNPTHTNIFSQLILSLKH
jgi:hypothetical protein